MAGDGEPALHRKTPRAPCVGYVEFAGFLKAEILRGIRRNYAADALRMTFYSLYVINYLPVLHDDCSED
jgi:hypothetical protein